MFRTQVKAALNVFKFALFVSWISQELLYLGPEQRWKWLFSLVCAQNLYRAAPAKFRTQMEQIRTHYEQPQFALETNWRIWMHYEHQHKNLKCLLQIKGRLKKNISKSGISCSNQAL